MHRVADRRGNIIEEDSFQDRLLERLYGCPAGRLLLKPLVSPPVSKLGGLFLSSRISTYFIDGFIRGTGIDMSEYRPKEYASFNDFFTRSLNGGARRVDRTPEALISPCDGRLSVYEISEGQIFCVKHTPYTAGSLLRHEKLAKEFAGGYVWVFRLCVENYHRYVWADGGGIYARIRIPGALHTVNPVANDHFPIYRENAREYCVLDSDNFGRMIQMEVGALFVGKIINHSRGDMVKRGHEKGKFAFGGSTVILMTRRDAVHPDEDILINSRRGIETRVSLGERVGAAKGPVSSPARVPWSS